MYFLLLACHRNVLARCRLNPRKGRRDSRVLDIISGDFLQCGNPIARGSGETDDPGKNRARGAIAAGTGRIRKCWLNLIVRYSLGTSFMIRHIFL